MKNVVGPICLCLFVAATACGAGATATPADDGAPDDADATGAVSRDLPDRLPRIERPKVVTSGTRIKGVFVRTADGAVQHVGLYDTLLNIRCGALPDEEGQMRCLPLPVEHSELGVTELFYQDSDCRQPMLPEEASCAEQLVVMRVSPRNTPGRFAVHRLGPAAVPGKAYRLNLSRCEPVAQLPVTRMFTLGEKLPPSAFLPFTGYWCDTTQPERLVPCYRGLADDTRVRDPEMLYDKLSVASCRVRPMVDGTLRCMPQVRKATFGVFFSDPACAVPVAEHNYPEPPKFATSSRNGFSCAPDVPDHDLGPKLALTTLFERTKDGCVPSRQPPTPGLSYHAVGAVVPVDRYSKFVVANAARGRLQDLWVANEEGSALPYIEWFADRRMGGACSFQQTATGYRCVPPLVDVTHLDESCADAPITRESSDVCRIDGPFTRFASIVSGPWCAPRATPVKLGPPLHVSIAAKHYGRDPAGACRQGFVAHGDYASFEPMSPELFEAGDLIIE